MTRSPPPRPTKAELGEMSVEHIDAYMRELQSELQWAQGFRYKAVSKELEVAAKVRELRRGREAAGDV